MSLSLITASYHGDFESCRLLADSIDAHVTGYSRHYIVVPHGDSAMFGALAGPRREIVDEAELLRSGLVTLPVKWRGRSYLWAPWLGRPIYGWHMQQLRKIGMTLAQPEARVLHVDSDNCFVRPFDASTLAAGKVPLHVERGVVDAGLPDHVTWWRNAHRLLGRTAPALPGDDFVGQMIVWEKASVEAMVARIEAASGTSWLRALAHTRQFSEYMIYGVAVTTDPALAARHEAVSSSPCLAYWDGPALDAASFPGFVAKLGPTQAAVAVQSFTRTPVEVIRAFALGGTGAA